MITFIIFAFLWAGLLLCALKKREYNYEGLFERESTNALRGFAILMILLHHAETNVTYLPWFCKVFAPLGAVGTAMFFCFSGFGNAISIRTKSGGGMAI